MSVMRPPMFAGPTGRQRKAEMRVESSCWAWAPLAGSTVLASATPSRGRNRVGRRMGLWVSGKELPYAYDHRSASVEVSAVHASGLTFLRRSPSHGPSGERFLPSASGPEVSMGESGEHTARKRALETEEEAPHAGQGEESREHGEEKKIQEAKSLDAKSTYEVIRREGLHELERSTSALAWSGLAAGLSMGFSFLVQGLLQSHLPDTSWRPLIANLGYTVGFVIVILG